jgi:putative PEP-CTERM system TPR-repeat lipoprotein
MNWNSWTRCGTGLAVLLMLVGCGLFMDEEALLERAQKARDKGDLRAAVIDLKDLLQRNPDSLPGRIALGEVALESGDVPTAVRELELARQRAANDPRVQVSLARTYIAAGRAADALALTESEGGNAQVQIVRGSALLTLNRVEEARTAFQAARSADPESVEALLGMTSAVAVSDGVPAAVAMSEQLLELAPEDARVHQARGLLQGKLRDFKAATASYSRAVELSKKQSNNGQLLVSLAGLADAQMSSGDTAGGLATTARLQELAPDSIVTRYARARALFLDSRLDEARPLLEQNLSVDAEHTPSKLLLGALTLLKGNLGQSEMYLASVVAAEPRNLMARQLLAEARLRQQKSGDALETLLPVLDDPGANAQLLALAARASLTAGDSQRGMELLRRGAQAEPENLGAQLELVAGYISTGELDKARELLQSLPAEQQSFGRTYLLVITELAKGNRKAALDAAIAAAAAAPQDIAAQKLAGTVLLESSRFEEALGYFERAQKLAPDSPDALVNLGRVEMMQGRVDQARGRFEAALQLKTGHPSASLALAFLDLGVNQVQRALEVLSTANKLNPRFIEGRAMEARVWIRKGDLKRAEQLAQSMVRELPEHPASFTTLARVQAAGGRTEESLRTLADLVRREPKSAGARFELARTLAAAARPDDAQREAKQAVEVNPRYLPAIELLARLALGRSDWTQAGRYAEQLKQLAPEQANSHVVAGDVSFAKKDYAAAAASYQRAGALARDVTIASREFQARRSGKLPQPLGPLEKLAAAQPSDVPALLALAQGQQTLGGRESAMQTYQRVLNQAPRELLALNNLAWLNYETGNLTKALELGRQAYEMAKDSPEVTDTYAWILVEHGDVQQGLALLARIADAKAAPEIRLHYAQALARGGKTAQALELARVLAASPVATVSGPARALSTSLETAKN